jgi:hypothetical protein
VAPPAGATEEARPIHAQFRQRRGQFADAVAAELIGAVNGQLSELLADDLTFLPEGARDHLHAGTPRHVVGDGGAGGQRFVVGVGVDEQNPWVLHWHKIDSPGDAAHR